MTSCMRISKGLKRLMVQFKQHSFSATGIRSLCWRGDDLVDWVGGGRAFALDGTETPRHVYYAYRFDAATASPDGRTAVIYERLGTKGLVLRDGEILREIDRSYYQANSYEYPVTLFHEPGGQLLLAHCPKVYNKIELEVAETGQLLTASDDRKPSDCFHSRFAASPNGKRLLSAGWVWHPMDVVEHFDVTRALADPHHLDNGDSLPDSGPEEVSACWLNDDTIVVCSVAEPTDESDERRNSLMVFDLANKKCQHKIQLLEEPGKIFPVGQSHILSLYRHSKLIDIMTGKVVHAWGNLDSGQQTSSIILDENIKLPPIAFDPIGNRFAIADSDQITVIEFDLSDSNPL
jgi:hypothetical protein